MNRDEVEQAVSTLRAHASVRRVMVATPDGRPYVDDAVLADRERGAASAASLIAVVELTAKSLGVDDVHGAVIHGGTVEILAQMVGDAALVAAVIDRGPDRDAVYQEFNRAIATVGQLARAARLSHS